MSPSPTLFDPVEDERRKLAAISLLAACRESLPGNLFNFAISTKSPAFAPPGNEQKGR